MWFFTHMVCANIDSHCSWSVLSCPVCWPLGHSFNDNTHTHLFNCLMALFQDYLGKPDNHASTPLLSLLQAGYPSCRPTNVKALKSFRDKMLEFYSTQCNLVPVKGRWCPAAGKVTLGLASHWPCVTDFCGFPSTGWRPDDGRWAPRLISSLVMTHFTS